MRERGAYSEIGDVPDMTAVMADAVLVDRLSRRDRLHELDDGSGNDPVAAAFITFVADLDQPPIVDSREWAQTLIASLQSREWTAEVTPMTSRRRRRPLSLVVAATAAGVVLASAGAAAAVTGSPFTPLRVAVEAVGRVVPHNDPTPVAEQPTSVPSNAADPAQVNSRLAGIGAALAQGRVDDAQAQLAAVQALLDGGVDLPPGQEQRLHNLEIRVQAAADQSGHGNPQGSKGGSHANQGQGSGGQTDHGSGPGSENGKGGQSGAGGGGGGDGSGTKGGGDVGGDVGGNSGGDTGKAGNGGTGGNADNGNSGKGGSDPVTSGKGNQGSNGNKGAKPASDPHGTTGSDDGSGKPHSKG